MPKAGPSSINVGNLFESGKIGFLGLDVIVYYKKKNQNILEADFERIIGLRT